jgi:methionine aminopeptidase
MDLNLLIKSGDIHHKVEKEIIDYLDIHFKNNETIDIFEIKKFIQQSIINNLKLEKIHESWGGRHFNYGLAFPICLSIDNIAAHYSPNRKGILFNPNKSIIKIDYGVHNNGNLVDSAFNYTLNPELKDLDNFSINTTDLAIKNCGIDSNIFEIGEVIEEYINSLELDINGKTQRIKSFEDLCGHKINLYKVHDIVPFPNINVYKRNIIEQKTEYRLKEGDYFAVEPYLTTGTGHKQIINQDFIENNPILEIEDKNFYIYNFNYHKIGNYGNIKKYVSTTVYKKFSKSIIKSIDKIKNSFNYLPFEYTDLSINISKNFKCLLEYDLFEKHDIVADMNGSYIAQTEKNFYINEGKTVVI